MSNENNRWIPIENLPEKCKKNSVPILVCDVSLEEKCGYNFPQVVTWDYGRWILTWSHHVFDKPITHYQPLYLTNGKGII